jgi:RNA polymerase sigma factor (sigma-70 family)
VVDVGGLADTFRCDLDEMPLMQDLRKIGLTPLLARLDDDLARAEMDASGQRDEAAWKELRRRVDHYAGMVARKPPPPTGADPGLLEDEWEPADIAQEVCAKLHARNVLAQVRGARYPAGYIVAMLRNAEADRLRPDSERRVGLSQDFADSLPEDVSVAEDTSREGRALQRALQQVSKEDRALYRDYYVERRPLGEIATALGISYSAATGRLRRLKERVRAFIDAEEPGP